MNHSGSAVSKSQSQSSQKSEADSLTTDSDLEMEMNSEEEEEGYSMHDQEIDGNFQFGQTNVQEFTNTVDYNHGEKDEKERPGITGSKDEGERAAGTPDAPR